MECKFVVGQHVLCIAETKEYPGVVLLTPVTFPEVGKVYTVKRIGIGCMLGLERVCIVLEEIGEQNCEIEYYGTRYIAENVLFEAACFRPLNRLKVEDFMTKRVLQEV